MKQLYLFIAILTIIATVTFQAHGATATASVFLAIEPIDDLITDIETNITASTALVNDYYVGEIMLLTAIPSDLTDYTYTWYKDDVVIGTGPTYEMVGLQPLDAGEYTVQLENQCGDTSIATTLEINIYQRLAVTVESIPEAVNGVISVASCDAVTFTALAVGGKTPLTYEWLFGTTPVGDVASLTVSPATSSDVGQYNVTVNDAMGREPDVYTD